MRIEVKHNGVTANVYYVQCIKYAGMLALFVQTKEKRPLFDRMSSCGPRGLSHTFIFLTDEDAAIPADATTVEVFAEDEKETELFGHAWHADVSETYGVAMLFARMPTMEECEKHERLFQLEEPANASS